jgi:hypothetical protein
MLHLNLFSGGGWGEDNVKQLLVLRYCGERSFWAVLSRNHVRVRAAQATSAKNNGEKKASFVGGYVAYTLDLGKLSRLGPIFQ